MMHLFSNIKYQLSGQENESLFHSGQATTMLGQLKFSDDFQKSKGLNPRAYARGVLGLTPPLELDILQNIYHLRKGNKMISHTFCLLICRQNANTTE